MTDHVKADHDQVVLRALAFATFLFAVPSATALQAVAVLHIRVTVVDADHRSIPVARHLLLISENPATAVPRRAITSTEGTVDVPLRPGNYTVESDHPAAVLGRSYEWTRIVDIAPGRDATLELNADNAVIGAAVAADVTTSTPAVETRPTLLTQWQESVVTLWTPHARVSGFLVDAKGLIATSRRAIGDATSVEVQLSPALKVAATVLSADRTSEVAVLWIDPKTLAGRRAVPLACAPDSTPAVANGQEISTIEPSLQGPGSLTSGAVSRVDSQTILTSFALPVSSIGGPVFADDGTAIGITSLSNDGDRRTYGDVRVARTAAVCTVMAMATAKMAGTAPPNGAHLPIESQHPLPVATVRAAAARRPFSLNPYQISSSDFDITFITPVLLYGAQAQEGRTGARADEARTLVDFGEWSGYVEDAPSILLIRVTPKLVESFWMKVARGAAETQGMSVPPIKRMRPGFFRMRVLCGGVEVTPIHPFKITRRVSETDAIEEGFYAFDPAAIGPHCVSVTLMLSSAKDPARTDTRVVDPAVIRRIWEDFAAIDASTNEMPRPKAE